MKVYIHKYYLMDDWEKNAHAEVKEIITTMAWKVIMDVTADWEEDKSRPKTSHAIEGSPQLIETTVKEG